MQRTLALGHTGNRALFLGFYPSTIWSRLPSTVQNALRPLELAHLNWIDVSFMVFFHFRDGYWALIGYQAHLSASVSSLPLFSFLFSEDSSSLSGPPHMLRVTSCRANNSPTFPRRDSGCCHRSLAHMCKWLMESFGNKLLWKGNFFVRAFWKSCFSSAEPNDTSKSTHFLPKVPHHRYQQFMLKWTRWTQSEPFQACSHFSVFTDHQPSFIPHRHQVLPCLLTLPCWEYGLLSLIIKKTAERAPKTCSLKYLQTPLSLSDTRCFFFF